jgi:NADH:ubiquinone oxidoreductase subunit 5 (subunit L)/multisubunit Na+/H+ antiporter MnhA subunit
LFRWLDAAVFPIKVSFGLQIDELSAAMLAATSLVAFVSRIIALFAPHDDKAARPDLLVAPFLVAGAAMLLLSPSVLQLFFFWQATALVTFAAGAGLTENPLAAAAARKAFLIGRVGDVALVFGMLLFWHHFRTPDWIDVLATPSSIETDTERLHALAAVGLCFLGSVVARCAQFPLLGWLEDVAATSPPRVLLWEAVVLLPTGVYVIARFAGIMAASESLQLLASFVGGVTAFLAALSAVYATDSRRAVAYASASLVGWMLLGFGSGESSGVIGATRLLLFHTLGMGRSSAVERSNAPNTGCQYTFLTSGFWGQSRDPLGTGTLPFPPRGRRRRSPAGRRAQGVFLILLCLETLATFLLALGMFRILFESGGDRDSRNETSIPIPRRRAIWVIPVMLISAAIVLSPVWVDGPGMIERIFLRVWPDLGDVPKIDFFSIALGLAPALAGLVCAWMKFGPGVRPAAQQSTMFPGVARQAAIAIILRISLVCPCCCRFGRWRN